MGRHPGPSRREDVASVGDDLWRLSRLLERMRAAKSVEHGADFAATMLLCALHRGGPMRLGALADAVRSDASTVSRQVAQLVADGLVERRRDPDDGRAATLALQTAGSERVEETFTRRDEFVGGLLADWDAADLHVLADLLGRLIDGLEPTLLPGDPVPAVVAS